MLRRWLRATAPRYRGEISLSGLKADVKIAWGPHGVPHVYAENVRDLFLAQGYLHAQERLWQMELNRRALCGRAAEIFGDRRLPGDLSVASVEERGARPSLPLACLASTCRGSYARPRP